MSLIVIEGLDGSGKGTQSRLLFESIKNTGRDIISVSFPDYSSPSSSLVKMYLSGEFGTEANAVNPFAASSFYAVDRYASFMKNWKKQYEGGSIILADRYTTSNIVFQLSKMEEKNWDAFIRWVEDFEYTKLGLPKPDLVIYADMPTDVSQKLLKKRYRGEEEKKDIHERDVEFLNHCRSCGLYAAEKLGWHIVGCAAEGEPRNINDIHMEILEIIKNKLHL